MDIEKRNEAIQLLSKRILQMLLPVMEKYFIWSAETGRSIFKFSPGKVKQNETVNRINKTDPWDTIWNAVHLNKRKKNALAELRESLLELRTKLQKSIKNFLKAKNDLLNVSKEISLVIQDKALTIFQYKKTLNMIRWINDVYIQCN